jgi:hypothetical protein
MAQHNLLVFSMSRQPQWLLTPYGEQLEKWELQWQLAALAQLI